MTIAKPPAPPETTDAERIDFLSGQVHALLAVNLALIKTHASLPVLRAAYADIVQSALAIAEGAMVTDVFIEGQQDIVARMNRAFEAWVKP